MISALQTRTGKRRSLRLALLGALAALLLAAPRAAAAESTVKVAYTPELGHYLVGPDDMTLYLYTRDEENKSNCSGRCLGNWPALTVQSADALSLPDGVAGTLGVITREDDGSLQVTYNGMPLYYWVNDEEPGQTTGHGVGEVWYVVNPAPTLRVREDAELGRFLVDGTGMTLYLYTRDEPGTSNCYGRCAGNWPPLVIAYGEPTAGEGVDASLISVVTREDGARQIAYRGMPLYGWIQDQAPGDTTGHGVGEVWYVVAP